LWAIRPYLYLLGEVVQAVELLSSVHVGCCHVQDVVYSATLCIAYAFALRMSPFLTLTWLAPLFMSILLPPHCLRLDAQRHSFTTRCCQGWGASPICSLFWRQ
jgi:hypothetical protein